MWVDSYECTSHRRLVVKQRVAWCEHRVAYASECEDLHIAWCVERCNNLLLAASCCLHLLPTLGLAHSCLDALFLILGLYIDIYRATTLYLAVHSWLHHLGHMLRERLLGILLHTRVYGGVDLQTIAIDIILLTIGLQILVTPAYNWVFVVLLECLLVVPLGVVVAALWLVGHHRAAHHLAEVCRRALVVSIASAAVLRQVDRQLL